MRRPTTAPQRARILALADMGWKAQDIADEVGVLLGRVHYYARGRLQSKGHGAPPDLNRYRRMVAAAEQADRGCRDDIATRFGLKDARSLKITLCKARQYLGVQA